MTTKEDQMNEDLMFVAVGRNHIDTIVRIEQLIRENQSLRTALDKMASEMAKPPQASEGS